MLVFPCFYYIYVFFVQKRACMYSDKREKKKCKKTSFLSTFEQKEAFYVFLFFTSCSSWESRLKTEIAKIAFQVLYFGRSRDAIAKKTGDTWFSRVCPSKVQGTKMVLSHNFFFPSSISEKRKTREKGNKRNCWKYWILPASSYHRLLWRAESFIVYFAI